MKQLENALVAIVAVLAPVKMALLTTLLLVLVDLLTGLVAARKQGSIITSLGLKKTIVKLLVYELIIVLSYLIDTYLTGGTILLLNIVSGLIGITELRSVVENLNIITGDKLLDSLLNAISSKDKGPLDPS